MVWEKIKQMFKNPKTIILGLEHHNLLNWLPDRMYLKIFFRLKMRKKLNLEEPQTFNEKMQWLKMYDRNEKYTMMVDKYEAKKYAESVIGTEYIIPTLGVWERFEEIDFDSLPDQFVLKCTHDSGGLVICREKSAFNWQQARKKMNHCLSSKYFYHGREWPYKNVKPRIIAEKYMEGSEHTALTDYKLMCFNGKVRCSLVCTDRFSNGGVKKAFYDREWKKMPFGRSYPIGEDLQQAPQHYEQMVCLAERMAKGLPFVRIDFYEIDGRIYFGEITFYPGSGMTPFYPELYDDILGTWITLPDKSGKRIG